MRTVFLRGLACVIVVFAISLTVAKAQVTCTGWGVACPPSTPATCCLLSTPTLTAYTGACPAGAGAKTSVIGTKFCGSQYADYFVTCFVNVGDCSVFQDDTTCI